MDKEDLGHIKLKVQKTAHVYTLGEDINQAEHIWFVFHGYGQLASTIISKFEVLDLRRHFVISIEGLSRFYWEGVYGKPVATWMTKADRLDEIDDYVRYIDQVYTHFDLAARENSKFNCLAFSQGTSTCWRWLAHRKPSISNLVQWAGIFPPELDYKNSLKEYISSFDHHFLYGDQDQFLTEKNMVKFKAFLEEHELDPQITPFEGEHKIYSKLLKKLVDGFE